MGQRDVRHVPLSQANGSETEGTVLFDSLHAMSQKEPSPLSHFHSPGLMGHGERPSVPKESSPFVTSVIIPFVFVIQKAVIGVVVILVNILVILVICLDIMIIGIEGTVL